jgi:hypothetical protein
MRRYPPLVAEKDPNPTQQTKPKKGDPITIPVPKKGDVLDFLEKTATLPDPERSDATGGPSESA